MVLDNEFPFDTRVENEAVSLIKAGHEVHLACLTRKQLPAREVFRGIIVHRAMISRFIYKSGVAALTFPFYFYFWRRFLTSLVTRHGIEVVHVHDLPLVAVGRDLKKRHNLKLVADLHENWPALLRVSAHTRTLAGRILSPGFLWVNYEKKILGYADLVIVVVSEAMERLENLGIKGPPVYVVSNTLKESEFELPDVSPDPGLFTLYYAGGITFHRGLQTVVDAVAIVREVHPGIRFRIAGSGRHVQSLVKQVFRLGLESHIEFLGHLKLGDVAANLAKADAALIPHLKTAHTDSTIPHKLFQYMYANKPVIASNCSPLERIITETGCGLIFRSGSPEDLADKILSVARKEVEIAPARKWVEELYNWKNDSETLIKAYNTL